jgi:ribosomal protein S18
MFVSAYNNYKNKTIDFIIYDPDILNRSLSEKYKIAIKNEY